MLQNSFRIILYSVFRKFFRKPEKGESGEKGEQQKKKRQKLNQPAQYKWITAQFCGTHIRRDRNGQVCVETIGHNKTVCDTYMKNKCVKSKPS